MGDLSNEPSMEDILASIKKIIAEDSDRKLSPLPTPRRSAPRDAEYSELGDRVDVAEPQPEIDDILELNEIAADDPVVTPMNDPIPDDIVSRATVEASRSALSSLSRMVVKPEVEGSDTLEGLIKSMLKPMLKDWLDAHLPEVVERVVAQEVARISGRPL
jgi:uncharacterized protein